MARPSPMARSRFLKWLDACMLGQKGIMLFIIILELSGLWLYRNTKKYRHSLLKTILKIQFARLWRVNPACPPIFLEGLIE